MNFLSTVNMLNDNLNYIPLNFDDMFNRLDKKLKNPDFDIINIKYLDFIEIWHGPQ